MARPDPPDARPGPPGPRRAGADAQRVLDHTFAHNPLGLGLLDLDGWFVKVNKTMCELTGLTEEELLAVPYGRRTRPDELHAEQPLLEELLAGERDSYSVEKQVERPDGTSVWCELIVSLVAASDDDEPLLFGQLRDITERRELEEEMARRGLHDDLTGLANRALFHQRVEERLTRGDGEQQLALVFMDVDDLKTVNDALGHAAGDELLRKVAGRLTHSCRHADTVARLGGDEFAVLLTSVDGEAGALARCEALERTVREPMSIGPHQLVATVSAGVRVVDLPVAAPPTVAELVADADMAMYAAKSSGKARTVVFAPRMRSDALARLTVREGVRADRLADQIVLHYQPVVRFADRAVVGIEALARWRHPDLGLLRPGDFLPTVLEMGGAAELCRAVLARLVADRRQWLATDHPAADLAVAVNVSAQELLEPSLLSMVEAALGDRVLPASGFFVELTEEGLVTDPDAAAEALGRLREMGVRIALDDFGSGYSSLAFLQRMPIDVVKLDREMVAGDDPDPGFLSAVVGLCDSLGLRVMGEGVEHDRQVALLEACGIRWGQGFHCSPPLHPDDLRHFLAASPGRRPDDAAPDEADQPAPPSQTTPGSGVVGPSM